MFFIHRFFISRPPPRSRVRQIEMRTTEKYVLMLRNIMILMLTTYLQLLLTVFALTHAKPKYAINHLLYALLWSMLSICRYCGKLAYCFNWSEESCQTLTLHWSLEWIPTASCLILLLHSKSIKFIVLSES